MSILNKVARKYRKALVTGGAGFIGSHICEKLVESAIQVICIDDYSAGKKENHAHLDKADNFKAVECDITDTHRLSECFSGVDIVFHNAAAKKNVCLDSPRRDLEVNAMGAFNLLELSKTFGVKKFIQASTGSVYGKPPHCLLNEDHSLRPISYYGTSKMAAESYVRLFNVHYGLDTTILRYFHVYGTRQEAGELGGVIAIFIRNMVNGEQPVIFGDGTQMRSFTYIKDVVAANLLVAVDERASGETYNCASGISVTIQELCAKVIEYFGKTGSVIPRYEDWMIGDAKFFNVGNEKIKTLGLNFDTDFFDRLLDLCNKEINN